MFEKFKDFVIKETSAFVIEGRPSFPYDLNLFSTAEIKGIRAEKYEDILNTSIVKSFIQSLIEKAVDEDREVRHETDEADDHEDILRGIRTTAIESLKEQNASLREENKDLNAENERLDVENDCLHIDNIKLNNRNTSLLGRILESNAYAAKLFKEADKEIDRLRENPSIFYTGE